MEEHQYMRSFISASVEYTKHPSEASGSVVQRNLGAISAPIDLSVFDPGSSIAAAFYVNLYELMNSLGSKTPLIWSTLDALQNACRNTNARQALMHTYKFVPILTRLLETNLTTEKRVKVLKLLQELTYGVKLSWQETYLPYLISSLTLWVVQSKDENIIALSLGILVNLCYKNLPAVYTLMRKVDTKTFVRTLLKLNTQSINTRVQCCKMMIILEDGNNDISERNILEFVTMTFATLVSALKVHDVLLLQHVVDFFDDVRQNEHSKNVLLNYPDYTSDVERIFTTIESQCDPECISLVIEFLLSLVRLNLPSLVNVYPMFVKVAMTWVPVEQVCTKALALIRTVVVDSRKLKCSLAVLAELDLSVLMLVTNCESEEDDVKGKNEKRSAETQLRHTELMQLLQEMARITTLKNKVMQAFGEQTMRKFLLTMLEHDDVSTTTTDDWTENFLNNPSTTLYVHSIALTADLATHDSSWLTLYSELLQKKQVQMVMALALYTGDVEVKEKVLQLTSSVGFSAECISSVARCMNELEPLVLVHNSTGTLPTMTELYPAQSPGVVLAPLFSFNQESRLDASLAKLEKSLKNQTGDIPTLAVMELYDYKLAAMRHAERVTQASLEAANNHATGLQHRLAQVVAESSRLHQLLFHHQQGLEAVRAEKTCLTAMIQAQERKIQEIPTLQNIVNDKSATIDQLNLAKVSLQKELSATTSKLEAFGKTIKELESKVLEADLNAKAMIKKRAKLKMMCEKLHDTVAQKEHIIEEREREIASNGDGILALKREIEQLGRQCQTYEQTIAEKAENEQRMANNLVELSRMRDMINQLTAKKKGDNSNETA